MDTTEQLLQELRIKAYKELCQKEKEYKEVKELYDAICNIIYELYIRE